MDFLFLKVGILKTEVRRTEALSKKLSGNSASNHPSPVFNLQASLNNYKKQFLCL